MPHTRHKFCDHEKGSSGLEEQLKTIRDIRPDGSSYPPSAGGRMLRKWDQSADGDDYRVYNTPIGSMVLKEKGSHT